MRRSSWSHLWVIHYARRYYALVCVEGEGGNAEASPKQEEDQSLLYMYAVQVLPTKCRAFFCL